MKIMSWNCRGFRKASAVQRCKRLVGTHSQDFLFLTETKINVPSVIKSLNCLGYYKHIGLDAVKKGGGNVITWKSDYDVSVLQLSMYFCLIQINGNDMYPSLYITFVYVPPKLTD